MTFPAGMLLGSLNFAPEVDAVGNVLPTSVTIELVLKGGRRLVWAPDGTSIWSRPAHFTSPIAVAVPLTDQPNLVDGSQRPFLNCAYRVKVTVPGLLTSNSYEVVVQPTIAVPACTISRQSDGTISAPVVAPPSNGTSLDAVDAALVQPHVQSPTPHPAYDDAPDFALLFNTHLI